VKKDEEGTSEQHQEPANSEDVPIIADQFNGPPAEHIGDNQAASEDDDPNKHKWADRWMVRLTAALAFFAAFSAVVSYLQWTSIDGQLQEMRGSGNQNERQIVLTIAQLNVATRNATSGARSAVAATHQFELSRKMFDSSQRHYIGVDGFEGGRNDNALEANINFKNFGPNPAENVSIER
jgi:hypothetical protein